MASRESRRRLIVNADDFGRSAAVNAAVIRAHREGVLTTASLMVTGAAADEAVALAHQHPRLGVGLHLTFVCGRAACPPAEIPDLVDAAGHFPDTPVRVGLRCFFQRKLRPQIARELEAQFRRFLATGLRLDHVNGHLHFHLHPVVFALLSERFSEWNVRHMRLTRDPLALNLRLASGRWGYRLSHALVFGALAALARRPLARQQIRHTDRVFGLLQNAAVDEEFVGRLLEALPAGTSELYSHPSLDEFRHELDALISPRVRDQVARRGIELIRYQDL